MVCLVKLEVRPAGMDAPVFGTALQYIVLDVVVACSDPTRQKDK